MSLLCVPSLKCSFFFVHTLTVKWCPASVVLVKHSTPLLIMHSFFFQILTYLTQYLTHFLREKTKQNKTKTLRFLFPKPLHLLNNIHSICAPTAVTLRAPPRGHVPHFGDLRYSARRPLCCGAVHLSRTSLQLCCMSTRTIYKKR